MLGIAGPPELKLCQARCSLTHLLTNRQPAGGSQSIGQRGCCERVVGGQPLQHFFHPRLQLVEAAAKLELALSELPSPSAVGRGNIERPGDGLQPQFVRLASEPLLVGTNLADLACDAAEVIPLGQ